MSVGSICIEQSLLKSQLQRDSIGPRAGQVRGRTIYQRARFRADEKVTGGVSDARGSFRGHEPFRPLCRKILDPLEFQGRRFAFSDDGRSPALSRGKIIALATAEHNFMVP